MNIIPNMTPHFYGYDKYSKNEEGKILLDRASDGKIIIKRKNTISFGGGGLIALCDGAKISTTDWQDLRRGFYLEEDDGSSKYHYCIGGSDAGAVMGKSSYSTELDIYNAKKSLKEQIITEETDYMFTYGHYIEPLIAQGFSALTNLEVFKNDCVFFNENIGFIQANVDYFIREKNGISILEIKSTSPNSTTEQLARNKEVPPTYYIQAVLHYPLALSPAFNIIGTYFAIGCDNILSNIKICHFGRDQDGETELLKREKIFIEHLTNNNPPKDTANPSKSLEKSGLKNLESLPIAVDLDNTAISAAAEYATLCEKEKKLNEQINPIKKRKEELQAIICKQLGKAAISTPFNMNGKKFVAKWESFSRETVNKTVLQYKYPDAYSDVVKKSTSRRFSLTAN